MSQYTSYYLYQKYEKRGDQPWLPSYPNVYSVDGDGTMQLVVKQEDDPSCGYIPPPTPIYRWIDLDPSTDWICADCNTKVSGFRNSGQTFAIDCDDNPVLTSGDTSGLTNLEYVVVGGCVTEIGENALSGYLNLSGVTIPSTVSVIGNGAFSGDSGLLDCEIPQSVTSIGSAAFIDCLVLQNVILWDTITEIGASAFTNCDNITTIHIPTGLTRIPSDCFKNCGALSEVKIPDNITHINVNAFNGCIGLFNLEIGSGITSIGNSAFYNCSGLTSIVIRATEPPAIGTNVFRNTNNCPIYVSCASIDAYAAAWSQYANRLRGIEGTCPTENLKYFAIYSNAHTESGACNSSSVLEYGEVNLSGLTDVVVGGCVNRIGQSAFNGASSLTAVTIESGVTEILSWAFQDCTSLSSISIPNTVTRIYSYAFTYCSGLTNITIPDSVTHIGSGAFNDCSSLTSFTLPSGVTAIEYGTFAGCTSLTSIDIPDSVTSIGTSAFMSCSNIEDITIPDSVTSIGTNAFWGCTGLTRITCLGETPPTLDEYAFNNTTCPIYVPCESLGAYKTAWSVYQNRIYAIQPCGTYYRWEPSGYTCIGYDKYQNNIKQVSYDFENWENVIPEEYSASTLIEFNSQDCGYVPPTPEPFKYKIEYTGYSTSASCDSSNTIVRDEIKPSKNARVIIGDCVTTIGEKAFFQKYKLISIDIPDSVTLIAEGAFSACSGLTSVNIGSGITTLEDGAFRLCRALTSMTIEATTPPSIGYETFRDVTCTFYVPAEAVDTYKTTSGWSQYASRIEAIT